MYREQNNELFCGGDLSRTLDNRSKKISSEGVAKISKDQFLATPKDDLVEHVYSQFYIEPLALHEDSKEMESYETSIDVSNEPNRYIVRSRGPYMVPGFRIVVSIPYTGNDDLWKLQPSRYQSIFPRAEVRKSRGNETGYLELIFERASDEPPDRIKQDLDNVLSTIRFYVDAQREQVEHYNSTLTALIREAIKSRQERLKQHEGISDILGIPLKRSAEAPSIKPIPIERTLVKPLPPSPKSGFQPEPGIIDEDYEHILSVIRHVGRTFEATPKTYAAHDEEELRDIILANLNGHYQGGATGETFRRTGKTDIRIEDQDRAAFVGECKVWRGPEELLAAVNQLLNYLTWRDCKASIIIFNKRNAKFTELLNKIPEILKTHKSYKRNLDQVEGGEWRLVFSSKEDELRQIIVNVAVFNLYVADK